VKLKYKQSRYSAIGFYDNHLYIIGIEGDDSVKIGRAKDVNKRLRTLQIGTPKKVYLIAEVACPVCVEEWLHELLADVCIRGEWFKRDSRVEALISLLQANSRADQLYDFLNLPGHAIKTLDVFSPYKMDIPSEAFIKN